MIVVNVATSLPDRYQGKRRIYGEKRILVTMTTIIL